MTERSQASPQAHSILLAFLLAIGPVASLEAQACIGPFDLGSLGGGNSRALDTNPDASVVVGESDLASGEYRAFLWTESSGMLDLGTLGGESSCAHGVSHDGRVVVGSAELANGVSHAFRWTAATGMQDLNTMGPQTTRSIARGVSADGTVVVGEHEAANGLVRPFRWTATTGLQLIGGFPNAARAVDVSADGEVLVGNGEGLFSETYAFRWTAAGGVQSVPGLPDASDTYAHAVNADGSVIVGSSDLDGLNFLAFRWTAATGTQSLGIVPTWGDLCYSAVDVSDGGKRVLVLGDDFRTARWTEGTGLQPTDHPGGGALAMSADGSTILYRNDVPMVGVSAFRWIGTVLGTQYCRPSVPNSTRCGSTLLASGDPRLSTGSLELTATLLPPGASGVFLTSRHQDSIPPFGRTQGILCLGQGIGRLGPVMRTDASGSFSLGVDLNALPGRTGPVAAMPGETWHFQAWHRDRNPLPTTNYTDAVSITFLR